MIDSRPMSSRSMSGPFSSSNSLRSSVTSRPEKFTISCELTKLPFRKPRGLLPGRLIFFQIFTTLGTPSRCSR